MPDKTHHSDLHRRFHIIDSFFQVRANDSTFGEYHCSAINAVGNASFLLRLVDSEAEAKEAAAFHLVLIAGIVAAVIFLIFLIVLAIRYYRKNSWKRIEGEKKRVRRKSVNGKGDGIQQETGLPFRISVAKSFQLR